MARTPAPWKPPDCAAEWTWSLPFAVLTAALGAVGFLLVPVWVEEIWLERMLGGAAAGLSAVPIAILLAWLAPKRPEWSIERGHRRGAVWILALLSAANLGATALAWHRFDAAMISGILVPLWLLAWIWGTVGWSRSLGLSLPVLFLWFALPWELFLQDLDLPLRRWSALTAIELLNGLGYELKLWHESTIYTSRFYVEVNETCSGMNMLVTLAMYTLIYGWITQRVVLGRLILLLFVGPLAVLANGARVAVIYLLGHYGDVELAMGVWHTGSAYLVFLPIYLTLYGMGRILSTRLEGRGDEPVDPRQPAPR